MENIFIGVDGGASKCIVRVERESGELIGRAISEPANIRLSVEKSWESIHSALIKILKPLSISLEDQQYQFHAGMGLAGCEVVSAYHAFLQQHSHFFHTLHVTSDAYTACLGAHGGLDGAIIISGTGSTGLQIQNGFTTKVGGWGFPHDDEGGGAWLGLQAVKSALHSLDGRLASSRLAEAIYAHFKDQNEFIQWINHANSTNYAELAPIVIQCAKDGEEIAIHLLQQAAQAIETLANVLLSKQSPSHSLPLALIGSVGHHLLPYLSLSLRKYLTPCQTTPDSGAIFLIRRNYIE